MLCSCRWIFLWGFFQAAPRRQAASRTTGRGRSAGAELRSSGRQGEVAGTDRGRRASAAPLQEPGRPEGEDRGRQTSKLLARREVVGRRRHHCHASSARFGNGSDRGSATFQPHVA